MGWSPKKEEGPPERTALPYQPEYWSVPYSPSEVSGSAEKMTMSRTRDAFAADCVE